MSVSWVNIEPEDFAPERPEHKVVGKAVAGHLARFLRTGGTVVVLGPDKDGTRFVRDLGLLSDLRWKGHARDGEDLELTRHHVGLGRDLPGSLVATDATSVYEFADTDVHPAAVTEQGAAALWKRVGSGRLVVLGMDFYAHDDIVDRLLLNAVGHP